MDFTRDATGIRIETQRFALRIDPATLRCDLDAHNGVRLHGFRPRALVDGRPLLAQAPVLDGWGELRTRLGMGRRLELRTQAQNGLQLQLYVEVADDWPGLVLELALRNAGNAPARVGCFEPLAWSRDAGTLELPGASEALRFYRMGYQSWSPAGRLRLRQRDRRGRPGVFRRMYFGPRSPLPRRGRHVSDFATEVRVPAAPGLALGFLTHERQLTCVTLEHARGVPSALSARSDPEASELEPSETLSAERLWVGLPDADRDGIAEWAERAGREMQAPVPARSGTGWCSWYHYFTQVRAQDVRTNLRALERFAGQIETLQIDDGHQRAVGDWLESAADFPDGVEPLAREIRAAGLRAGIWLAPFLVSRRSRTAAEHPDWLVHGARGRPLVACVNPTWEGGICYALDPTHPDAIAWLEDVVRTLRGFGFDYLKLDFLYAGMLPGRRREERSLVEAYREAIRRLRAAAEPDPFLVGCGAPLGPSIGLFETMRIGPDVAPVWRERRVEWITGVAAGPSVRNALRNVLARAALHQRLWLNDPDCVLLRDRDTRLTSHEVRALAATVAVSGGPVVVSDALDSLTPARERLLRKLLPPLDRSPEPLWSTGAEPDGLATRHPDGSVLVLRINTGRRRAVLAIHPSRLGLSGRLHVWDALAERYLGLHPADAELRPDPTPGHAPQLLRLTPDARRPALIGSTLHTGAGAIEVARLRAAEDRVRLRLRLPGARSGRVVIQPPAGDPIAAGVEFADELEVELGGVEVTERMTDL